MGNRNWQGWAALVLAGLALVVALSGRGYDRMATMRMYAQAAPQAPQAPQFQPDMDRMHGQMERGLGPGMMGPQMYGRGDVERGMMGYDRHHGGFLWGIFGLLGGLIKLAALGALAWLLFRIYQQRNAGPAPTTPAGHDPRVE